MASMNDFNIFRVIDRVLLFSWLLKDFGWMTTNIYLGFPFGIVSVLLHTTLFFIDTRRSYRFYNTSLLIWVCGNFIWMTTEFVATTPSSRIHMGPDVPIGGFSDKTVNDLINLKTILFLIASSIQVMMYICIYNRWIDMPEEENEDIVSRNELNNLLLFGTNNNSRNNRPSTARKSQSKQGDFDSLFDLDEDHPSSSSAAVDGGDETARAPPVGTGLTLALLENAYIMFWLSKDLFWSWGTGDLTKGRELAVFYETTAMMFGSISVCIYLVTAYVYRRNFIRFLDSVTMLFWISANFVWMCGEFFIRYDSLAYDDGTEHNDQATRIVSAVLFCSGMGIQLFATSLLIRSSKKVSGGSKYVEMFAFGNFSPLGSSSQHGVHVGGMGGNGDDGGDGGSSSDDDSRSGGGGPRYDPVTIMVTAFSPQHASNESGESMNKGNEDGGEEMEVVHF